MSGNVSITCGPDWVGYPTPSSVAHPGSAVSAAAEIVLRTANAIVEAAENSLSLFGRKADALSCLHTLAIECAEDDWDGNNAHALDPIAIKNTEAFLRSLPESLPLPDLAPEPDGSISLDWSPSRQRIFSMSISASNRLAYAWLDGAEKGRGVARFDGTVVPSRILRDLEAILPHDDASFRAA